MDAHSSFAPNYRLLTRGLGGPSLYRFWSIPTFGIDPSTMPRHWCWHWCLHWCSWSWCWHRRDARHRCDSSWGSRWWSIPGALETALMALACAGQIPTLTTSSLDASPKASSTSQAFTFVDFMCSKSPSTCQNCWPILSIAWGNSNTSQDIFSHPKFPQVWANPMTFQGFPPIFTSLTSSNLPSVAKKFSSSRSSLLSPLPGAAGAVFAKGRSSSKAAAAPGVAGGAEGGVPTVAAPRPNNEAAAAAMGKHGRGEDLWQSMGCWCQSLFFARLIWLSSQKLQMCWCWFRKLVGNVVCREQMSVDSIENQRLTPDGDVYSRWFAGIASKEDVLRIS